ncbi:hypothetical protein TNCV_4170581 [Trichonephila clavipes]|nr:hypothetical protein TNCV_4170581 [Trichonephila clavipes]
MTGQIYWVFVLEQCVHLFRGAMDAEFVFMDDNSSSLCKYRKRMLSIGRYHLHRLASILNGLESGRTCVGHS